MQKRYGNASFKAKAFREAADFYKDGVELVDLVTISGEQAIQDLKVTLHQNLAMCLNQTEDYDEAIYHCTQAIQTNGFSAKAYYVKSQAFSRQQEWGPAIAEMKACIMLQPNDRKLRDEYEKLNQEKQKSD